MYNNIKDGKCQAELKKEFNSRKKENILLSESYGRIMLNLERFYRDSKTQEIKKKTIVNSRVDRVAQCSTFLEFAKTDRAEFKLHNANFCRDRLCPTCSWRRSLKVFSQVSKIMDIIEKDYKFLFLTLTVPNVSGAELKDKIDEMQDNFRNLFCKNVKFKKVVKGFFRSLEVTHDTNKTITAKKYRKAKAYYDRLGLCVGDDNSNFDKYHPHFHCILAVNKSYANSRSSDYITRDEWLEMWQKAMNDYSITQVDIRVCKTKERLSRTERMQYKKLSSAVCEVAKYSVKSNDYIVKDNEALTDSTVETLFFALHRRRLCGLGGCFKKAWEQIRGQEKELGEGDLVDINGNLREDVFVQLYRYCWSNGCYKLFEVEDCKSKEVTEIIDDVDNNMRYAVNSETKEVEEIGEIISNSRSSERPAQRKVSKTCYNDDVAGCIHL